MAVVTLMSVVTQFISVMAGAAGERCEPLLLIVVKALVKRLCRIGQFAQCGAGVREGSGALAQALDQICAGLGAALAILRSMRSFPKSRAACS